MDLSRAFRYAFDDAEWAVKLAMVAVLHFAMLVFMPVLFLGLVPLCVLLGYMLVVIDNVRKKEAHPLPRWDDLSGYAARGAGMLPAIILYNMPLVLIACCMTVIRAAFGSAFLDGIALLAVFCCLTPLLIVYVAYTWPMLAHATSKYARGEPARVFFEVGKLSDAVNAVFSESMQLVLAFLLVNAVMTLLQFIPIVGQLIFFALYFPIMAHLIGQYARIMEKRDPHRKRR